MKRLVLSAVALSMLALPISQAQAGPRNEPPRFERQDHGWKKKPGFDRKVVIRKKEVTKKRWVRGNRVPDWQRKHVVRDYNRYGLRQPPSGYQYVRSGNDVVLAAVATGLITAVIAGLFN